eukprot:1345148-Amphidinium_carterae.1
MSVLAPCRTHKHNDIECPCGIKCDVGTGFTAASIEVTCWHAVCMLPKAIAKNEHFEHFFLLLIVLNALWIAYDTDNNKAEVMRFMPCIVANSDCC